MQMRLFTHDWRAEAGKMQAEVNDFLASLPQGAVKHVNTATAATRTALTDKSQEHYVITVWYDV